MPNYTAKARSRIKLFQKFNLSAFTARASPWVQQIRQQWAPDDSEPELVGAIAGNEASALIQSSIKLDRLPSEPRRRSSALRTLPSELGSSPSELNVLAADVVTPSLVQKDCSSELGTLSKLLHESSSELQISTSNKDRGFNNSECSRRMC